MEKNQLTGLIQRYLDNELQEDEYESFFRAINSAEGIEIFHQLMKDEENVFAQQNWKLKPEITQQLWNKIESKTLVASSKKINNRVVRIPEWTRWAVAAAIAGVVLTVSLVWQKNASSFINVHTVAGEIRTVQLPDGSVAVLNENSTISYDQNLSTAKLRKVKTEGEVLFTVKHTVNNTPFVVAVNDGLLIKVLGTTFNISEYKKKSIIVLQEGKIQLEYGDKNHKGTLNVKAGEKILMDAQNQVAKIQTVNTVFYTSWPHHTLQLSETKVSEICERIEDRYDIEIQMPDRKFYAIALSGQLPGRELEEVLKALAGSLSLQYRLEKNKAIFY